MFWEVGQTKDGRSILTNPQAQNSYSYSENNPIVKKDPGGRFVPQAVALGFVFGGISNAAYQGITDIQTGHFSGLGSYLSAAGRGGVVGATSVLNPFFGAGTAGVLSLSDSYRRNSGSLTAQDAVNAAAEGALTGVTAGYLKSLPQVKGTQASNIFGSQYYTGAHAQRYAQEAVFGLGAQVTTNNVQGISNNILSSSSFSSLVSSFQKAFQPTTAAQGSAVQKVLTELNKSNRK